MKIVKHCATRWLSLEKCVKRVLQQWPALCSYFQPHEDNEKPGRVKRIADSLTDPLTWLIFSYLDHIIPLMTDFNTAFQAGAPMVGHLHTEMQRLMRKLLGKFVTSQTIIAARDVTTISFETEEVQHPNDNIAIGLRTREYIKDNEDTIPQETIAKFYQHVRLFYITLTSSLVKKFPFKDDILKTLSLLNPETRDKASPEAVVQLGKRVLPDIDIGKLQEEAEEYNVTPIESLPPYREAIVSKVPDVETMEEVTEASLLSFWVKMRNRTLPGRAQKQFSVLGGVALACLTIPHSNADLERCFSILRKIQTDSRHKLSTETIHSLISVKFNEHHSCVEYNYTIS
ncbi:uncharacterized protein LOC132742270 isoform X2 [Ruditapes philippinarum]|nr:uncharacterized protein LOC132742270 isoform X2 [Ruditapes philippinarum]